MALNPALMVASKTIQETFFDPDTGAFLANGLVRFWDNISRTTPKNVFQYTNNEFVALANPLTLSAAGQFMNPDTGELLSVYYYMASVDDDTKAESYYVEVCTPNGAVITVRENWPPIGDGGVDPSDAETKFITTDTTLEPGWTYICNGGVGATPLVLTMPTQAPLGAVIKVIGVGTRGADPSSPRGWKIQTQPGTTIQLGILTTAPSGALQSTHPTDSIVLTCASNNNDFYTAVGQGNILVNT